ASFRSVGMSGNDPLVVQALRLPELCREVCRFAGLVPPPAQSAGDHFIVRSGNEPPALFARLIEEAFAEDSAEVAVEQADEPAGGHPRGEVSVRPGFAFPCPAVERLRLAARPQGGAVLLFAVERRSTSGELVELTWAALPDGEPPPAAPLRAAVMHGLH